MNSWFRRDAGGTVTLRVHAQPGARATEVADLHGGALKIRVAAPATEDRANAALVDFLSAAFKVPRRSVTLAPGAKSREKRFAISGSTVDPASLLNSGTYPDL